MMCRSMRSLSLIVLMAITVAAPPGSVIAQRDPLASVVEMEAPQLETVPSDIFTSAQRDRITGVVNEARLFGVPLVVRVVQVPAPLALLSEAGPIAGAAPSAQELTQRLAEEWLFQEGVETSVGAEDGVLLLVVIPEGNPQMTTAAFATGDNALPLNGLTGERLDSVLTGIMQPFFEEGTTAVGVHIGIAYLSYDNLFAVPSRLQPTAEQEKLRDLTNVALVGATSLGVLALGGLVLWIRHRDRARVAVDGEALSPFEAGALARGRADEPVATAALLHLINRGAINARLGPSGKLALSVNPDTPITDPFEQRVMHRIVIEAGQDGQIPDAAVRRLQDVLMPAREWLQDDLAMRNLFNKDARVETTWIILGSAALGALALFSLVPSMVAMSRLGIFSFIVAMLAAVAALTWAARRPWSSQAGREALTTWLSTRRNPDAWAIFDMIVHQDALLETSGGPDTPAPVRTVRELRALGAR